MNDGLIGSYGALPIPKVTPELLALVQTGSVYSLSVSYSEGMMVPGPMASYMLSPRLRHGDLADIRPASAAAEVITMSIHVGTHIDALCHIGEHRDEFGNPDLLGQVHIFAGANETVEADAHVNFQGQRHMDISMMPPIITRAVLLDIARQRDLDVLPDSYVITAEDIAGALESQGVEIHAGTAVLIRTGFYKHLHDGNLAYRDAIAGIGLDAARFLLEKGMMLVGADNMTVEAFPPYDHAVHRLLLVRNGVTHLENLYLEQLAANKVYEFLLIVTPLRLQGATGSWVHPIAIA